MSEPCNSRQTIERDSRPQIEDRRDRFYATFSTLVASIEEVLLFLFEAFVTVFVLILLKSKALPTILSSFYFNFAGVREPSIAEKLSIESQVSMCELILPNQVDPRGILRRKFRLALSFL